jgi:hypothetical protein
MRQLLKLCASQLGFGIGLLVLAFGVLAPYQYVVRAQA